MTSLLRVESWFSKLACDLKPKQCAGSGYGCTHTPRFGRQPDGIYLHGEWYCSAACFERGVLNQLKKVRHLRFRHQVNHRIPLGLLLLSQGVITRVQLSDALSAQRKTGKGKVGEWLLESGATGECQVTQALSQQWSCPVLKSCTVNLHEASLLPLTLLESYRMVPFHFAVASSAMYVAFSEHPAYPVLESIQNMLHCRTEACLITPSEMNRNLDEVRRAVSSREAVFERIRNETEIAAAVRSYALECSASDVRISNCGMFIWVRVAGKNRFDLLFRNPEVPVATESALELSLRNQAAVR